MSKTLLLADDSVTIQRVIELTFAHELMTGFISGELRPISGMTIGAFHDMGYAVNYDAREGYSLGATLSAMDRVSTSLALGPAAADWEEVLPVRVRISLDGRRRRAMREVVE